jgi:O-antigen biosynthesis protein
VWSESWSSADERLNAIEQIARREGAAVFAGGSWDRWDLHLRGGLIGAARLRMGVEEHGGGRQMVRIEVTPYVSTAVTAIVAAVVVAAVAATVVGAWQSALLLAAVLVAATARVAWEAAVATAWLEHACGSQTATAPDPGTSLATEPA